MSRRVKRICSCTFAQTLKVTVHFCRCCPELHSPIFLTAAQHSPAQHTTAQHSTAQQTSGEEFPFPSSGDPTDRGSHDCLLVAHPFDVLCVAVLCVAMQCNVVQCNVVVRSASPLPPSGGRGSSPPFRGGGKGAAFHVARLVSFDPAAPHA